MLVDRDCRGWRCHKRNHRTQKRILAKEERVSNWWCVKDLQCPFLVDEKRDMGREGARKRLKVRGGGRWKGGGWEREERGSGPEALAPRFIRLRPYAFPYLS